MASNAYHGIVRRAAARAAQWAAAGLIAAMFLPFALAVTLVIAFGEAPPDFDES